MERRFQPLSNLTYSKISYINDRAYHNVYCVLLEIYDWKKSAGADYMMSLKVSDKINGNNFIFIKIFSKEIIFVDKFKPGDVLRARNIKFFKNNLYVIDHQNIIDVVYREGMNKDLLENDVKDVIKDIFSSSSVNEIGKSEDKNGSSVALKTLRMIKDINQKEYVNFTGTVTNVQVESNNLVILSLIDNTCNNNIKFIKNSSKYSNDMILYVKIWDTLTKECTNLKEGDQVQINNLKVFIKDNILQGTLSDNNNSTICKLGESSSKDDPRIFSFSSSVKNIKFDEDLFSKINTTINEIKNEGFFKLSIRILRLHPHKGYVTYYCKECKITGATLSCDCEHKEMYVVLKLLVEDKSGSNTLLCKNKVAEYILKNRSDIDQFECLITSHRYNEGLLFEIIDLPFFYK